MEFSFGELALAIAKFKYQQKLPSYWVYLPILLLMDSQFLLLSLTLSEISGIEPALVRVPAAPALRRLARVSGTLVDGFGAGNELVVGDDGKFAGDLRSCSDLPVDNRC